MSHSRGWIVGAAAVTATFLVVGCIALSPMRSLPAPIVDAFANPDEVTLYSLTTEWAGGSLEQFHGFAVLGKTEVKDAATRRKLFTAFANGIEDHDGSVAACFIPHHGLRVRTGKQTLDLVICFLCAQVRLYDSPTATKNENILISKSPRTAFNEVLRAAGVPLDKAAE